MSGTTGYNAQATQWLNENLNNLPIISGQTYVNSIFVSGADVYKAGRSGIHAVYWKNNTIISLDVSGFDYTMVHQFMFLELTSML